MSLSFSQLGAEARTASQRLATLTRADKDTALHAMADALSRASAEVISANQLDIDAARQAGMADAIVDRLTLDQARVDDMVAGLRSLAGLPDPVGEMVRGWSLANGVQISQVRVPLGVVGIIYEARPNVTADAAGICLKSGNACLLRGSSSAINSNRAIVAALRQGLGEAGLPQAAVNLVEGGRDVTAEMMAARGVIDVLIPRGGAGLINAVVENARVPVLETGTGNCHLFVDAAADFDVARSIIRNAKTQRPSVCNALETLLVHEQIAADFVPALVDELTDLGVTLHGDAAAQRIDDRIVAAGPDEFDSEYLSLDLAIKIVPDIAAAITHIRTHSTGHSETIVTENLAAQREFVAQVDAAAVLVNASSRFVDGGQFGFGAEIGISTQKLHARGPMGLPEMTSTKYVVLGDGQIRQ